MKVTRFDGVLGGDVSMSACWTVLGSDGQKLLTQRNSIFKAPAGAATYEALVSALSGLVADLCREIAAAVDGLPRGQH